MHMFQLYMYMIETKICEEKRGDPQDMKWRTQAGSNRILNQGRHKRNVMEGSTYTWQAEQVVYTEKRM
jgi:hypothetical protein